MSKKPESHETASEHGAAPAKTSHFQWSTLIAAIVCIPLGVVSVTSGREWYTLSEKSAGLQAEMETLLGRNTVLEKANDILQNHKFQVCNKSTDTLTIPWVSAVYHDGKQLVLFDSSHCPGWRTQFLNKGETRIFTFSSTEEGCNWSGTVMFYGLHYTRESDEYVKSYNVLGPWRGFDRDCFTVE